MRERIIDRFLKVIYPDSLYCICCGKAIDWSRPYSLCDNCMRDIKWTSGRLCRKCGKMLSPNNPDDICYNCKENEHAYSQGYSCSEYDAHDRSVVFPLKYHDRPGIARVMGEIMADRMLSLFTTSELAAKYDLIVPIPISDERRKLRGYNQAALIAEFFADKTGLNYEGEVLIRVRETLAMKGLTADERKLNLAGCFDLAEGAEQSVLGANCLLIDDIVTTGATMDEAARTLKNHGAVNVDFVSFANGADVVKF